jgi:hypothetical protein
MERTLKYRNFGCRKKIREEKKIRQRLKESHDDAWQEWLATHCWFSDPGLKITDW